jgi:1-acyl-sn-glycerol-3-phosphate acyltransferase
MRPKIIRELFDNFAMPSEPEMVPAKLSPWVLFLVHTYIRIDLFLHNRLHILPADLALLKNLPRNCGIILTSNHADETDFKLCLELSRLINRKFFYFTNKEAFQEMKGFGGWILQRIGCFSVERGGDKTTLEESKNYAIDIVKASRDILIFFPEGEIYYLNDQVQPFKSGVIDIGLRAITQMRESQPDWTTYMVPMGIKYLYSKPIDNILAKRIEKLEKRLTKKVQTFEMQRRLVLIMAELLHRQEIVHNLESGSKQLKELTQRVQEVRQALITEIEEKYPNALSLPKTSTPQEKSWNISAYLKELPKEIFSKESFNQMKKDLETLGDVVTMASWQPEYVQSNPSQERLAETVLKLERELFRIKRPHQLAHRKAFLRVGQPINLGLSLEAYQQNPHPTRHELAEYLRKVTQGLIDSVAKAD